MDDLFGPGSFLGGILGMNKGGGADAASFGALGSSGPAVNNGMPMSGLGPAGGGVNAVAPYAPPGSNVNPGTPGVVPGGAPAGSPMNINSPLAGMGSNPQSSPGLLGSLLQKFGGGGQQPGGGNQPTFAQKAAGIGQQYLKNANQPIKAATFQPMQLQGPIPQQMNLV